MLNKQTATGYWVWDGNRNEWDTLVYFTTPKSGENCIIYYYFYDFHND